MAPRMNPPGFALRGPPGRRYSDPFGQTILEMMQRDSELQYLASMRLAEQAGEGWRTAGNIAGSVYPAYQDLQVRRREEEDRQRALEDRERALARQGQADLAARSEAERRSLHGATRAFLDEHLGPTVPPVTAGVDGGPPQGGIEALPPSAMSFAPYSYERIIPKVRVDDEGVVSGGIEDLAQGAFPIRTEPKRHVYYADQPGVDPETLQPYPKVPWEITSDEDIEQKKLDLRDLERQQTIDAEQRAQQDEYGLIDYRGDLAAQVARTALDDELTIMGVTLRHESQKAHLAGLEWDRRAAQTLTNDLIKSGDSHENAVAIAKLGTKIITGGVQHTWLDKDGNERTEIVLANESNFDGRTIIPTDDFGMPFIVDRLSPTAVGVNKANEIVERDPVTGELQTLPGVYKDAPEQTPDAEAMLGERVQGIYARQLPRGRDNLTLWQAIDLDVEGISGILAPITAAGQQVFNRNPEAQKLRDEIGLATEGFSNMMTAMGQYRSSSQAVSNILERVGNLKGSLFAGDVALEERANAWLDAADRAVEAYTAPGAIDYDNAEQVSQLYALLSSALTLQEVLGMPNRPLIAGGYLTPEQRDRHRPGGPSYGEAPAGGEAPAHLIVR